MIWTLHRRLGLMLGPAVLLWFLSGVVILWVPYPSLTEEEWFSSARALSARACCASFPSVVQKLERPEGIESLRIRMVGDRPVAVAQGLDGSLVVGSADSGDALPPSTREDSERIVRSFAPKGGLEELELMDHDVWTVHQRFDPYRPLWKVQLSGADGRVLYVSSVTGDVVQDTTAEERRWNLVGAVIHWWYWPWLRRHWAWWDQLVWWLSGIGTVMVVAGGLILGREWVKHGWSGLFVGRWRLHRALGVIAGISAGCWMASGWLSMDHGRWFSDGKVNAEDRERFMGGRLTVRDVEAMPDFSTMLATGIVKEIRLTKLAGIVHIIARTSPATQTVLTALSHAEASQDAVSDEVVRAAARSLLGDGVLTISKRGGNASRGCFVSDDDTVLLQVETSGHESSGLLVDRRIGVAMERLDPSRRLYHHLFDSLHRWDVSWFSEHCDLRRMLMSFWCVCGAGLAGSGIWIGLRRPQGKVLR